MHPLNIKGHLKRDLSKLARSLLKEEGISIKESSG